MAIEEEVIDRGDFFEGTDDDENEEIEDDQEDEESNEDDDDSEGDEDSDEDGGYENEEEEEVTPPKKEPRIPKSRFDEINNRMKDANERNLWLEEQLEKLINQQSQQQKQSEPKVPEAPKYDYDAAEEEYINLIIGGDIAKATKLRNDINKFRQKDLELLISGIENKANDNAKSTSSLLLEKERFESSITNMESKYPFLNHKDKSYNEEAVETVNTLLAGYLAAGKGKVESLQLAIKKVLPLYEKKGVDKPTLGNQRKVEAGKKAAAASKQQPAKQKTNTRTSDMGKVNVNTMTDRDFSKLTAKEKSILRGD
jgi:hypothetical protein